MLVCLACTFIHIDDLFKQVFFGSFSPKPVFPFTSPIAPIVDNSLEMIFARKRVNFDILEHLEFLQNLDFISEAHNIATKFVT